MKRLRNEWYGEPDIVSPPSSMTVNEPKIVLFAADGTPLRRQIGFTTSAGIAQNDSGRKRTR